jgi:hypothetical protein
MNRAKDLILAGRSSEFTPEEVENARQYWSDLTDEELLFYWRHYTTGQGRGLYTSVHPDTPFEDYLVLSASESAWEKAHDV